MQGQSTYSEAAVKAFLLERIVSFLRWPGASPAPSQPLQVVVLGNATLGRQLERLFAERPFAGRPLSVRRDDAQLDQADIVVIGAEHSSGLKDLLRSCDREGVLTVGDSPGFAARGVAVNFYREHDRLRFEIHPPALKRAGIQASYKLLTLARIVEGRR